MFQIHADQGEKEDNFTSVRLKGGMKGTCVVTWWMCHDAGLFYKKRSTAQESFFYNHLRDKTIPVVQR